MAMQAKIREARDAFKQAVKDRGFVFIGPYVATRFPVRVLCPAGHDITVYPADFRRGSGCRHCLLMDSEDAKKRFYENIARLKGTVVGTYVNAYTKVECTCENGHKCEISPGNAKAAQHLCMICYYRMDEVKEAFYESARQAGVEVIGPYTNSSLPVLCKCPEGHECSPTPTAIQQGLKFCSTCTGTNRSVKAEKFYKWMEDHGFQVIGEFINSMTRVESICPEGHTCHALPLNITTGKGMCITCKPASRGEQKVKDALTHLGITFVREYSFGKSRRRYDFELSEHKIIIETDGQQHFMKTRVYPTDDDLMRSKLIDILKMCKAEDKEYTFVRIDYTWYGKPVEDFVKFIKDIIDIPYEDRPWAVYSNPDMYKWIDEIRASCSQQPAQ